GPGLGDAGLQPPRAVGMAGARARERAVAGDLALVSGAGVDQQILPRHRVGAHDLLPLRPLGVRDLDREGGAEGAAVAQPSVDRKRVLLGLLPAAAPVAEATTGERRAQLVTGQFDADGDAVEEEEEGGAVGLPGREPAQHACDSLMRRARAEQPSGPRARPGEARRGRPGLSPTGTEATPGPARCAVSALVELDGLV